jgi:SAM-dependent methyltransferase
VIGFDFGYAWPFTYGHLFLALIAGSAGIVARIRRWPRWVIGALALVSLWAFAGFFVVRFAFLINKPLELPTRSFLASGAGTVLDMGCGSGRATLMVLLGRPHANVVALDNFSADYIRNARENLQSNVRAAGVERRVRLQPGDMRNMPFESGSFDGVVSTYAIDHLDSAGRARALAEAERVLRPGGQFLVFIMNADAWTGFAAPWGLLRHGHGKLQPNWRGDLQRAGLTVVEEGTLPATRWFLCRKLT